MNKQTPGKWIAESDGEYWNVVIDGAEGIGREIIGCEGLYRCDGSDEANARLIASAPDLLESLQQLVSESVNPHDGSEYEYGEWIALDKARAAIAKATGDTNE